MSDATPDATPSLFFLIHGQWKPVMKIHCAVQGCFCKYPLLWLLFVATRIWSMKPGCRGVLCDDNDPNGPAVDYSSEHLPPSDYYFHCISGHHLQFPDTSVLDDRSPSAASFSSSSSFLNPRPNSFQRLVQIRDQNGVLFDVEPDDPLEGMEACHLVPRIKTSDYMRGLNAHLGIPEKERVDNIDSPRNGILLSATIRAVWTSGSIAFLSIPNELLQPEHFTLTGHLSNPSLPFLVTHQFNRINSGANLEAPNNAVARHVQGPKSVAAYLLDYLYIVAVLKAFGIEHNYPDVNVTLVPNPQRELSDNEKAAAEEVKDPSSAPPRSQRTSAPHQPQQAGQQTTWEKFCILGARTNPALQQWRQNVATATK
ncbi:hypothetical protein MKEN_00776000 [Mycena kentingensis (nom. inval.)]|nr:hypothetical protein MKEN_00776000 [Mycena kentingensis (nom. inval.)]